MIKTIKLLQTFGKYEDNSPFLICENDNLIFEFKHFENLKNRSLFITLTNADITKSCKIIDNKITVDQDLIFNGVLSGKIDVMKEGDIINSYNLEPLILKTVANTLSAVPEIEDLKKVIAEYTAKVDDYMTITKKLKKIVSGLCNLEEKK